MKTAEDRLAVKGYFTPTYVSLIARATISRHSGTPILEAWNNVYHYWTMHRKLSRDEVVRYLGSGYLQNMEPRR